MAVGRSGGKPQGPLWSYGSLKASFRPHPPASPRHRKRWQEHPTAENALRRKCQPKDWQKISRAEKMLIC